jgi:hypothetical protein
MNTSYELRTIRRNSPVYVFDDIVRAKAERDRAKSRGVPLNIVKVTRVEEIIS